MRWPAREQRCGIHVLLPDSSPDMDALSSDTDRLPPTHRLTGPNPDAGEEPDGDSDAVGAGHDDKPGVSDGPGETHRTVGRGNHEGAGSGSDVDTPVARPVRRRRRTPRVNDGSADRSGPNHRDGRVGWARRHCGRLNRRGGRSCGHRPGWSRREQGGGDGHQGGDHPEARNQAVETPIFERSWSTARVWI